MSTCRSHHGFVSYRGSIWAVGGTDGKKALDSVESLDPTTFKWKRRHHLLHERAGASVCVHKDAIWVIGGRCSDGEILSSVEVYDGDSKGWKAITSL